MKNFLKWMGLDRPEGTLLHPARTIEIAAPRHEVMQRCVDGIELVLGGVVRERDDARGRIEATFGLIFSERLSCTVMPLELGRVEVVIESRRGVRAQPGAGSPYVDELARYLTEAEPK